MIKLHGFSSSNYYNVPKLAMMEKGIEFEEALTQALGRTISPSTWTGRHWARFLPWKHPRALSASLVRFSTTLSASSNAVTAAELGVWCGEGTRVITVY